MTLLKIKLNCLTPAQNSPLFPRPIHNENQSSCWNLHVRSPIFSSSSSLSTAPRCHPEQTHGALELHPFYLKNLHPDIFMNCPLNFFKHLSRYLNSDPYRVGNHETFVDCVNDCQAVSFPSSDRISHRFKSHF